jgi:predicted dehydrogenase
MTTTTTHNFALNPSIYSMGYPSLPANNQRLTTAVNMQNKPNVKYAKIRATSITAGCYASMTPGSIGQNKPNFWTITPSTKKMQNKPNFPGAKMNLTASVTMNYRNFRLLASRKNKPNFKFFTGTLGNNQTLSAKGRILIFDFLLLIYFETNPIEYPDVLEFQAHPFCRCTPFEPHIQISCKIRVCLGIMRLWSCRNIWSFGRSLVMSQSKTLNRRSFLKKAVGASASIVAFPYFVPASALGKNGTIAPSNRLAVGSIGTGGRGHSNMRAFMAEPEIQVVAACDVDLQNREKVKKTALLDDKSVYRDFREVISHDDIDIVIISTPDHWHVPISIAAIKTGKDVYCEKPLTLTIAEGRKLCDTVTQYSAVFQVGSQQRSGGEFQLACELVRSGSIGKLKVVKVGLPGSRSTGPLPVMPIPEGFDYDMWLGPAPWKPYTKLRCHGKFRHMFDYSGGKFIDWGTHHLDIVQWALGSKDSGPVEISGWGEFPTEGIYNTAVQYDIDFVYSDGTVVNASTENPGGILFEGDDGQIFVNRGKIEVQPQSLVTPAMRRRFRPKSHIRDFIDCVKMRKDPIAPAEVGHRSSTVCHLGNISMRLGRKLKWNPVTERFVSDSEADRMMSRSMRSPWRL